MIRFFLTAGLFFVSSLSPAAEKPIQNGDPIVDEVLAAAPGEGVLSATQYLFEVPQQATEVVITLLATPTTLDIDLEVRIGAPVELNPDGGIVSDYFSETPNSGNETVRITSAASPPLQPGTYYIGVVNYATQDVTFFLTASYSVEESTVTPTATSTPTPTATATETPVPTVTTAPATPTETPSGAQSTPTPTFTLTLRERADLDGDGEVDPKDLLLFIQSWKQALPGGS